MEFMRRSGGYGNNPGAFAAYKKEKNFATINSDLDDVCVVEDITVGAHQTMDAMRPTTTSMSMPVSPKPP